MENETVIESIIIELVQVDWNKKMWEIEQSHETHVALKFSEFLDEDELVIFMRPI